MTADESIFSNARGAQFPHGQMHCMSQVQGHFQGPVCACSLFNPPLPLAAASSDTLRSDIVRFALPPTRLGEWVKSISTCFMFMFMSKRN